MYSGFLAIFYEKNIYKKITLKKKKLFYICESMWIARRLSRDSNVNTFFHPPLLDSWCIQRLCRTVLSDSRNDTLHVSGISADVVLNICIQMGSANKKGLEIKWVFSWWDHDFRCSCVTAEELQPGTFACKCSWKWVWETAKHGWVIFPI